MLKLRIVQKILTDGSSVFDVLLSDDYGATITLGAYDYSSATRFAADFARTIDRNACHDVTIIDAVAGVVLT